jgi:probable rRNA maturation factor
MSPFLIEVSQEIPVQAGLLEQVLRAAETCLELEGAEPTAALSVLLTDDHKLHELNRAFMGVDGPTDVLSFPAGEPMPGQGDYLGDIAVSVPMARRQAAAGGHAEEHELMLLVVHGVLHLLGHDHADLEEGQEMWRRQSAILGALGVNLAPPLQA